MTSREYGDCPADYEHEELREARKERDEWRQKYEAMCDDYTKADRERSEAWGRVHSINARFENLARDAELFVWAINEAIRFGHPIDVRVGSLSTVVSLDQARKVRAALKGKP